MKNSKLIRLLIEAELSNKVDLISRRSPEERQKNYLAATQKKIKEYMKSGGQGDLDLNNTKITSLPKGLEVDGSLNLSNTPITSLPQGLKVGGDLDLKGTPITSLPQGLKVRGLLNLENTKITSLPQGLEVGGGLFLISTPITSLPQDLKVGGGLLLTNTPIARKYSKEEIKRMVPGVKGEIYLK